MTETVTLRWPINGPITIDGVEYDVQGTLTLYEADPDG